MMIGREQRYHPGRAALESAYIYIFGMPIVGLRIRARNIFSLIPVDRQYRRILDAGSGPGVFAFELGRRFPQASVLAVDPLPKRLRPANTSPKKFRPPIWNFAGQCLMKFRKKAPLI